MISCNCYGSRCHSHICMKHGIELSIESDVVSYRILHVVMGGGMHENPKFWRGEGNNYYNPYACFWTGGEKSHPLLQYETLTE